MFENWATRVRDRERLESNSLHNELDVFVRSLESQGYPPRTLRRYLFAAAAFGRWVKQEKLELESVDESTLQRFFSGCRRERCRGRRGGRLSNAVSGVRRFVEAMRSRGLMPPKGATHSPGPIDDFVIVFELYLRQVGGLVLGTRRIYGRYARALLEAQFGEGAALDFNALDAQCIGNFVLIQAGRLGKSSRRLPATATRTFLRFLIGRGLISEGLVGAVPTVRQWRHASLPSHLSVTDLTTMFTSCASTTNVGRRNCAILMILARLGLRSCELAALRLDDIRWHEGLVLVRGAKSHRQRMLPLPDDVGAAVASYLRDGRPSGKCREVFLAIHAPHNALTPTAVSSIVARTLQHAGISSVHRGAHLLRHTAATRMVRAGATFKEIADVLGHARIETTTIYAKLDVDTLAAVALPWPEATP